MTAAPADRAFATFRRGEERDAILTRWRNHLRATTNPSTGVAFSEREIATATATFTRWYNGADAVDLILLAQQARAQLLADQIRPDRANTEFLRGLHAVQLGLTPLPSSGGSGLVNAPAPPGTTFIGSTTPADPAATFMTDESGKHYQVLFTETVDASGIVQLSMLGIDTGPATNLIVGAKLNPANGPIGFSGPALVATNFRGGRAAETDKELARRILWRKRHKQASGNNAHFRGWADEVDASIEDAFVYACALEAGSVLVAITGARGTTKGPLGRIPSVGALAAARAKLTPPGSADVPGTPAVVVTSVAGTSTDLVARLILPRESDAGWEALDPWPGTDTSGTPTTITTLTSQMDFRVMIPATSKALPAGVTQPPMMVWNASTSRFERLNVQSVALVSGLVYHVLLNGAPATTLATGAYISPATAQADVIDTTIEGYFDTLGPGEVVDITTSLLGARAQRFPDPTEEFPQRAGSTLLTMLDDALGSALGDRDLPFVSVSTPPVPSDPASGPALLVAGRAAVYPLDS